MGNTQHSATDRPALASQGVSGTDVILAAGGLLCRSTPRGPEIAIIHRRRYGGDWTLPKGKFEKGESWESAALREVKEETGYEVSVAGMAGVVSYIADNRPKVVVFFKMSPAVSEDPNPTDKAEVAKAIWVQPDSALRMLSYAGERHLVEDSFPFVARKGVLSRWWQRWTQGHRRLSETVRSFRGELQKVVGEASDTGSPRWAAAARYLLAESERAVDGQLDTEEGWRALQGAMRMTLWGLPEVALAVRAIALREESEKKLGSWRKPAVQKLLDPATFDTAEVEARRARLVEATELRDESFGNEFRKVSTIRRQLWYLGIVGLVMMIIVLTQAWLFSMSGEVNSDRVIWMVLGLGAMGGLLSALLSLSWVTTGQRYPERLVHGGVTLLRPIVGGLAAVGAYALLVGGFLPGKANSLGTVAAFSFVAGFSERFFLGAVELVAKKGEGQKQ